MMSVTRTARPRVFFHALAMVAALGAVSGRPAVAAIQFQDVSGAAGVGGTFTESWGAAVGDFDDDLYPDIFVNNHRDPGQLYLNDGTGLFQDVSVAVDASNVFSSSVQDAHGAVWADIDNDGDQDLTMVISALQARVMVNSGGVLTDQAQALGIDLLHNNGSRMPVYFDYDNDGLLDLKIVGVRETASDETVFMQQPGGGFSLLTGSAGLRCLDTQWAQLTDVQGDGRLDFLCGSRSRFPAQSYDIASGTAQSLALASTQAGRDAVSADFNGDLLADLLIVRGSNSPSEAVVVDPNLLEVQMVINGNGQRSLSYASAGSLDVELTVDNWNFLQNAGTLNDVYIGSSGYHPTSGLLTLDSANPLNQGIQAVAGRSGLFIGYNTTSGRWTMTLAASGTFMYGYFSVASNQPQSNVQLAGVPAGDAPVAPQLLLNVGGSYQSATAGSGLGNESCISAVAGDFDNDGDEDLFLACRGGAQNIANVLYENDGAGGFQRATNFGAEGATGPALAAMAGTSESVVTADFDLDGFLDLFVTNGLNKRPVDVGGEKALFRNLGNANGWLQFDLQGVASNRDGLGARVVVTTPDNHVQLREVNGGYHRWSQNFKRVHVGLGAQTQAQVEVTWPSGQVDTYTGVQANAAYRIIEGQTIEPLFDIPAVDCGAPSYNAATDKGIFLWQDCASGAWQMDAVAGGSFSRFRGLIDSNQPLSAVTGISLESTDALDNSTDPSAIDFDLRVGGNGTDAVNFFIVPGVGTCFRLDAPAVADVFYGVSAMPVGTEFDLETGGSCVVGSASLAIASSGATEDAGVMTFDVTLSGAATGTVTVDVTSSSGSALDGVDYGTVNTTLTFNTGEISQPVAVTLLDDAATEGDETFTLTLGSPTNASIATAVATGTIFDDETNVCGQPSFSPATDKGIYLWQSCADGSWQMDVSAGGSFSSVAGSIGSGQNLLAVTAISLEGNDLVDFVSDPTTLSFTLLVGGNGSDSLNLDIVPGAGACFDVPQSSVPVFFGVNAEPAPATFDLETRGTCTN